MSQQLTKQSPQQSLSYIRSVFSAAHIAADLSCRSAVSSWHRATHNQSQKGQQMPYTSMSERRSIRASKTDVPLPDYHKTPRPIHLVWDAHGDVTATEINRLLSLFKNKDLEGLTGEQGLMDTREVLTALLAYRNIPIKLLHKNIPKHLRPVVDYTMSNLVRRCLMVA